MASKRIRIILVTGSVSAVAFLAGKYHERINLSQTLRVPVNPAVPVFNSFIQPTNQPGIVSASYLSTYEKAKLFARKLVPKRLARLGYVDAEDAIAAEQEALDPYSKDMTPDEKYAAYHPRAKREAQLLRLGIPGTDCIQKYNDYILSYDRRNRVAHWVLEHLTEESVRNNDKVDRAKCNFKEDDSIHIFFRSQNSDFKGSGYDRGHLAAAGNHKSSQKNIEETFYLPNIAPQVGKGFNRDSWNRLEKYVRKLTKIYPHVYCCTGPLYLPKRESDGKMYVKYEVIGANHVAVPTHFFKVVVGERKDHSLDLECYVMQNAVIPDSIPLKTFQVPPELVERAAGLLFIQGSDALRIRAVNGEQLNTTRIPEE